MKSRAQNLDEKQRRNSLVADQLHQQSKPCFCLNLELCWGPGYTSRKRPPTAYWRGGRITLCSILVRVPEGWAAKEKEKKDTTHGVVSWDMHPARQRGQHNPANPKGRRTTPNGAAGKHNLHRGKTVCRSCNFCLHRICMFAYNRNSARCTSSFNHQRLPVPVQETWENAHGRCQ